MTTLNATSVGSTVGISSSLAQTRGAGISPLSILGGASGDSPATVSDALVAQGVTTPMDEISQEAALVDGAISMPARPLAEIIWQVRAAVNDIRGSGRASRTSRNASRDASRPRDTTPGMKKAAGRAYAAVQSMGTRPTPVRSVDIYHGGKK